MFKTLGHIAGKVFGTEKAVDKVFDTVQKGVDKSIFTTEEKMDYHLLFLRAYEPFKVAQRFLAAWFSVLFGIWGSVGVFIMVFINEFRGQMIIDATVELFGYPVLVILGFYFMGGAAEGYARAKSEAMKILRSDKK